MLPEGDPESVTKADVGKELNEIVMLGDPEGDPEKVS